MNLDKLKELCNEFTVTVSFNGFYPFTHKVIDANKLFEKIHETSELPKEDFINNINNGNFMSKEIEDIFNNVKHQGKFLIAEHKVLGNHSYIECKSLNWL
jgi:hypothetical protein